MRKTNTSEDAAPRLVVTTDEAAARLGISPRTLERWRLEHRGPVFVKLGKRRCYRIADLEAFLLAGTVRPEAA
jgi:excisionase family DNA binding protein